MARLDLAAVLAGWRADAAALGRLGVSPDVMRTLERCAADVELGAEEWLLWLSAADAMMRNDHSAARFRSRREDWKREGHARQVSPRRWFYRACIVPTRGNVAAAAARGHEAAARERNTG